MMFGTETAGQDSLRNVRIAPTGSTRLTYRVLAPADKMVPAYREPLPSLFGIIHLILAAIGMPQLARRKRELASQTASAALKADATESALCGYLSLIALAGLLASAIFHVPWADPIAALALVPFIVREGWQAIRDSKHCCNSRV
jgi:divalent metal cation (Fe/Co/Zn/Cd) transporter